MKVTITVVIIALVAFLACLKVECENCKGTGRTEQKHARSVPCPQCSGKGLSAAKLKDPSGDSRIKLGDAKRTCLKCQGKGTITEEAVTAGDCAVCGGTGKLRLYSKLMK